MKIGEVKKVTRTEKGLYIEAVLGVKYRVELGGRKPIKKVKRPWLITRVFPRGVAFDYLLEESASSLFFNSFWSYSAENAALFTYATATAYNPYEVAAHTHGLGVLDEVESLYGQLYWYQLGRDIPKYLHRRTNTHGNHKTR